MAVASLLSLLALSASLTAAERMKIVSVSPDVVVRRGESVNISCGADQDWFFCLWKHPSGVKECSIQENGGYRSVCAGLDNTKIFGGERSCSLMVEKVSLQDHGDYMCLLNQADVFHTDRKYVSLAVASPARLEIRRLEEEEETSVLELVEGELVEVECSAAGAFPRVEFLWSLPGVESVEARESQAKSEDGRAQHLVTSQSVVTYTARVEDTGQTVRCSAVQSHKGEILYSTSRNLTLLVSHPAPLLATRASHVGIITGGLLALLLVLLTVGVSVLFFKNKKRVRSSQESVDQMGPVKEVEQIWMSRSSRCQSLSVSEAPELQCTAEVHNSSEGSGSSSGSSPPPQPAEQGKKLCQGDFISYSPAYMYSSYEAAQTSVGNSKSYKPRGLGHFDPSTDVHSVTRPNTGSSLLTFQPQDNTIETKLNVLQFPSRPLRPARIYPGEAGEPGAQSWDISSVGERESVASVFDCRHGCFTPDPSEVSFRGEERVKESSPESVGSPDLTITPDVRSNKSLFTMGASSNSLVPVNIPIDISTDEGDYTEIYHNTMGHLYTVKTRDMEL